METDTEVIDRLVLVIARLSGKSETVVRIEHGLGDP